MFTGIVQSVGTVTGVVEHQGDLRIGVDLADLTQVSADDGARSAGENKDSQPAGLIDGCSAESPLTLGESIAVNGCCLTVTRITDGGCEFDVSGETLSLTTIAEWKPGTRVNLERALLANSRLGGHIVSGHLDGVGRLASSHADGRSTRMRFSLPRELARFVAEKGSITVDGVSLTVNSVEDARTSTESDLFDVNLVPHTLSATTLGTLQAGQRVHLEVDIIARYLARLSEVDT